MQAAEELNYRPSRAAVALRLGKFNTIGLVVPDLTNSYFASLAEALESAVREKGFDLVIETSRSDVARERHRIENIVDRQVDGLVCCLLDGPAQKDLLESIFSHGKAIVAMTEAPAPPLAVDCVSTDFTPGMRDAMRHLLQLGHHRFAYMRAVAPQQREGGRPEIFRNSLAEFSSGESKEQPTFKILECDQTVAGARAAMRNMLKESDPAHRPTAVIAHNDVAAIGVMRAAIDLGLSVPGDLSVVGVDDSYLCEHLPVSLTSVGYPNAALVAETVNLLMRRMEKIDEVGPRCTNFSTHLVVRESTGPAPQRG